MPCFKGIAVSIHANGAPLPEYGMQKQSRFSRISTYIPVPQPQISRDSNKPEPARFAISITLLTPGLPIPYSTPKPTASNTKPKPQYVGSLSSSSEESGKSAGLVSPYIAMTHSPNETIAAYIYFDGRAKEEVATLLRPGEETWVNSRWVQIPEAEGGGLAEREFLFREVGLERWLNGLDLEGHDAAEKLQRRRQKFEMRRRNPKSGSTGAILASDGGQSVGRQTLRYGTDQGSPVEPVFDDTDSLSEDDEPPEATGQIKVAMFRVLASGEIKKGEYSPQFDAHDDDEDAHGANQERRNASIDADVEHTTSFAKPKSLDPSTISTQTVTGIDGPDKPYATFTFFYRGERQLQKIGVLAAAKASSHATPGSSKRRSGQLDFSNLGPLRTSGTVGFSAFRDGDVDASRRRKARKKSIGNIGGALNDDSDEEDDDGSALLDKMKDIDEKDGTASLGPEDVRSQGELADGLDRIRLKRTHSADPPPFPIGTTSITPGTMGNNGERMSKMSNILGGSQEPGPSSSSVGGGTELPSIESPLKKHCPSTSPMGDPNSDSLDTHTANNQQKRALLPTPDEGDEEL